MYEYQGVIHVHTRYSDGNRVATAVIQAARDAGLDFLVITDHNSLGAREAGLEGWNGRTLVIVGEEITPPGNANHFLALATGSPIPETMAPEDYAPAVQGHGGIGFIAHPDDVAKPFLHLAAYPWTAWNTSGYDGFEIWNYTTDWASRDYNLWQFIRALCFPLEWIQGPPAETLRRWDRMNKQASPLLAGIVGADAHGYGYTYKRMFRHIRNHVWLPKPLSGRDHIEDTRAILKAVARGRLYGALDGWKPATGFSFTATSGHTTFLPGDIVTTGGDVRFTCRLPYPAAISLLCDGVEVAHQEGTNLVHVTGTPGVYRVEVYGRYHGRFVPWIFTNPIRLDKKSADLETCD